MTTLADLTRPRTRDELTDLQLALLADRDFPVTAWQEDNAARTLIAADVAALEATEQLVADVAKGGFLDTASGAWLTLRARDVYGVERKPATFAGHVVRLTAAPAAGPHTLAAGAVRLVSGAGLYFRSTTGGTLEQGGTLDLEVVADAVGPAFNLAAGTPLTLVSSLAGVTAAVLGTVEAGAAEESDASLRQRCRDALTVDAPGSTVGAYRTWATTDQPAVRRVLVRRHASVPGRLEVYLAGESGGVDPDVVEAVQAVIDEKAPLTDAPVVASVAVRTIALVGTAYVRASRLPIAPDEVSASLARLAADTAVGGDPLGGGAQGIARASIIEAVMGPEGMVNVSLATPTADVVLDGAEVPVFDLTGLAFEVV